jgi:hypothetical protein
MKRRTDHGGLVMKRSILLSAAVLGAAVSWASPAPAGPAKPPRADASAGDDAWLSDRINAARKRLNEDLPVREKALQERMAQMRQLLDFEKEDARDRLALLESLRAKTPGERSAALEKFDREQGEKRRGIGKR